MEVRSYRRVFDLERRIYRVDRLRLNPGGVPVRGIVYFLLLVCAALTVGGLPLLGDLTRVMPWYLRDLALPASGAALLSVIRVEGRPFHLAAYALVRYRLQGRWSSAFRPCEVPGASWHPGEIVLLPDGSESRMRRLRYTGPGAVLITRQHQRSTRSPRVLRRLLSGSGSSVELRELPGRRRLQPAQVLALGPRARLLVGARARSGR